MKYIAFLFISFCIFGCTFSGENSEPFEELTYVVDSHGKPPWSLKTPYLSKGQLLRAISVPLLHLDNDGNVKPGVLKSWRWDASKKTVTFDIDQSFSYPSGGRVQPEEIEFLLLKFFITSEKSAIYSALKHMEGTEKLRNGMKFKSGMCSCVTIKNTKQITVHLRGKNYARFLFDLADIYAPVGPIKAFDSKVLFEYQGLPEGVGRYKVLKHEPKESLVILQFRDGYKGVFRPSPFG